jgi:hypothetical protein
MTIGQNYFLGIYKMAYGQYSRGARTTRTRRSYPKRSTASTYRKVVKPARQAIPALARQVATIKRQIRPLTRNVIHYSKVFSGGIGNAGGNNVFVLPLNNYSSWTRVFGADADDESGKTAMAKYMKLLWKLNTNGERNTIDYSMFVVSLKKNATDLFNASNGNLNAPVLNTHYVIGNNGQGAFLNPNFFNIMYSRRWTSGTTGSLATDTSDLVGNFSFKLKSQQLPTFTNPAGDWKANNFPREITKNMYLIIFNNDSIADAAVQIVYSQYIQMLTV